MKSVYYSRMSIARTWVLTLFSLLLFIPLVQSQRIYADRQSSQVSGLCLLCGVNDPNNPVHSGSLTDFSTFAVAVGLLGVSVEQTLIFPSVSSGSCDSLVIGIGSGNALLTLNLFGDVTIETANGSSSNNDVREITPSILRLLENNTRAEVAIKPAAVFDRVKVKLNVSLLGLLENFRLYYAYRNTTGGTPPIVTPLSQTICGGENATFSVPVSPVPGTTIRWYAAVSGGTPLFTGNIFTVAPTVNTTYYAAAEGNDCNSARVAVAVIVSAATPAPVITAAGNGQICQGGSVILTAQGDNIRWYDAARLGNLLSAGNSYTVSPSATTIYYADASTGGCISSTRSATTVTVSNIPQTPIIGADSVLICRGDTALLAASNPGGLIQWYNAAAGGALLFTGSAYPVSPQVTTIYYAATGSNDCGIGIRKPVKVVVKPTPVITVNYPNGISMCAGDSLRLVAQSGNLPVRWYDAPAGGNFLAAGAGLPVSPRFTTIFYAEVEGENCRIRKGITVVVRSVPQVPGVLQDNITICKGETARLQAESPNANIKWFNAAGISLFTGNIYTVNPVVTTDYYVAAESSSCVSARKLVRVNVQHCTAVSNDESTRKQTTISTDVPTRPPLFFPNPTTGAVQVSTKILPAGSILVVNDLLGKPVYRALLNNNNIQLPAGLPAGVYIFRLYTPGNQVQSEKVILKR